MQILLVPALEKPEIEALLTPFDETFMGSYTISKLITSRTEKPNVPEVKEPYLYPELADA